MLQSQTIKDFNRQVQQEVELLQINRVNQADTLNIPRDYEHLDSNVDLFQNNVQSKDKAKNSTIYYLDGDRRYSTNFSTKSGLEFNIRKPAIVGHKHFGCTSIQAILTANLNLADCTRT